MDRKVWRVTVHGVSKSWTGLSNYHFCVYVCKGTVCVSVSMHVSMCVWVCAVCICTFVCTWVAPTGLTKARGQLGRPSSATSSAHAGLITKEGCSSSPDHPQTIFLSISCCDGYKCCSNFSSFPEIYKMVYSVTLSALLLSFLFCHVVAKQREE